MIVPPNASRAPTAASESDPALDALIDRLVDRLQAGEVIDVEACVRDHPDHESQIRGLLPALEMMAALGNDPRPGLAVLGDYRVVREIGRGGMGVVFEAVQVSLGRRVALKILPAAAAIDPRHLQRFQLEAQAAAHLHHPHIVPIHAVGRDRGVHYYVMQFIEGRSLADLIREGHRAAGDPAPAKSTARLGIQAAEALDHAHSLGILHRDIKPANLLIEPSGHLWVVDFGLARFGADSDLTRTGDLLGTLRYMSPEQALADRVVVDHRTDVYSLGATLYELLTGRPAVDGRDRQELLRRIAAEDLTPPRQLDPSIPRVLETIVLKAMAREPQGRYAFAKDLADDLRRFLADEPIRARRPGPRERVARWTRRHRPAVVSTAVVLGLALLVGTGLLWKSNLRTEAALASLRATVREKDAALESLRAERYRERVGQEHVIAAMDRLAAPILVKVHEPGRSLDEEDRQTLADLIAFHDHTVATLPEDPGHAEVIAKAARRSGLYRSCLKAPRADRDYERAIRILDEAARRKPQYIWLRTELIDALREYADGLAARGRPEAAEEIVRRALTVAEPLLTLKDATYPCFSKGLARQFDPLARSLASRASGSPVELALAVRLAEWSVAREPDEDAFRRTLALCRDRKGESEGIATPNSLAGSR